MQWQGASAGAPRSLLHHGGTASTGGAGGHAMAGVQAGGGSGAGAYAGLPTAPQYAHHVHPLMQQQHPHIQYPIQIAPGAPVVDGRGSSHGAHSHHGATSSSSSSALGMSIPRVARAQQAQAQAHLHSQPPPVQPLVPSVRAVVDSLTQHEMWTIARDLNAIATEDRDQARRLLLQYPTLAKAVLLIQERLQMLQKGAPMLVAAPTAGVAASHAAAGASAAPAGAAQPAAAAPAAVTAAASQAPAPAGDLGENTELLRRLLSMPDAEVEALAPEEQEGVMQIRNAVRWTRAQIEALPNAQERADMLLLRDQLQANLGILPNPG